MSSDEVYVDLLEGRRVSSDAVWACRTLEPVSAYVLPQKYSASDIKLMVLNSTKLRHVVHQMGQEENVAPEKLYKDVSSFLDEMGYKKEMSVLRTLGLITSKILKRLCSAIYINEPKLLKIKSEMGQNPVLFVPTHRSYADFILMSYICFHYEIAIPRIAAGLDFQNMAFIGEILRDTGAFFMRRSFSQDKLYSATFSEYVQSLVTHGDAPVEFFIEGTRSRTGKALTPKFGFLSMVLKPFFTGLVPDVSIVPINLTYDRCLEESLFAYEMLGVPKPKESTRGFLKALRILKEDFGKVFVNFGDPLSVKELLEGRIDRSVHGFGPIILQDVTPAESKQVMHLAHTIVNEQKQLTPITPFNLIAAVLTSHYLCNRGVYTIDHLCIEVRWLADVLRSLGAQVVLGPRSLSENVAESLQLHGNLVCERGNDIELEHGKTHSSIPPGTRLRGSELSPKTMDTAVPFIMLQHYVNPLTNYIINMSAITLSVIATQNQQISYNTLMEDYSFFRSIFAHEFAFYALDLNVDLALALKHCTSHGIIFIYEDMISLGKNKRLQQFSTNFMASFIPGYTTLIEILISLAGSMTKESVILKCAQESVEKKLIKGEIFHPANLSLDLLGNCLQSLPALGGVVRTRSDGTVQYIPQLKALTDIHRKLLNWMQLMPSGSSGNLLALRICKL